jgi:hypothetical protein
MARRTLLTLLLVNLLSLSARCGEFEDRYGIGTVLVEPYNFFSLAFWAAPNDVMPYDQVYFFRDSLQDRLHFQFATMAKDSLPAWFSPEIYTNNAGKYRITFVCLQRSENWCRIVINKSTGLSKWVELGVDIFFEDWGKFFSRLPGVTIAEGDALLYESPKEKAKTSRIRLSAEAGNAQLVRAKKIDGMWMQVEVTEYDDQQHETGKRTGWIRWRDEAKMFLRYD